MDPTTASLTDRKQSIHQELTAILKSIKPTKPSPIKAKVIVNKVRAIEITFRALQTEIITFNSHTTVKKDQVIANDFDSFVDLLDAINEICLGVIDNASTPITTPSPARDVLPKVNIPVFDGDITLWENFRALYDALVHSNNNIDDAKKLQYLRLFTSKEAHATVAHFLLDPVNYKPAYDALIDRYASKRRLGAYHVQRLLNHKPTKDALDFLEVHRTATSALKNMNLPDLPDFLLFQMSYANCDSTLKSSFDNENNSAVPTLDELLAHVSKRAKNRELALDTDLTVAAHKSVKPVNAKQSRTYTVQTKANLCAHCQEEHQIYHCETFKVQPAQARVNIIKQLRLCFNCMGTHGVKDCKSKSTCRTCSRRHHTLLHVDYAAVPEVPATTANDSCLTCTSRTPMQYVLLATVQCLIKDSFGQYHRVCALLDNASQRSLVTSRLANRLGLTRTPEARSIVGVSGRESNSMGSVHLDLRSCHSPQETLAEEATVLPHICGELPSVPLPADLYSKFTSLQLADPEFNRKRNIDILLGADAHAQLLSGEAPNVLSGHPTAIRTRFGWVIFGATTGKPQSTTASVSLFARSQSLSTAVTRFWEVEEIDMPSAKISPDDVVAETHFIETHARDKDGRYILRLPFRPGAKPEALSNRSAAARCLQSLERRLQRQPQLQEQYTAFMEEFARLQHMQIVNSPSAYVMPHHCVLKESTTTKLRCVFNASAKDVTGTSLNELLLPGPKLQADIADILVRFRFHNIALCSDIKMMFRMLSIHPEDTKFQRIFWRPAPTSQVQEYEILRVVYGMTSSSFLAQRTLRQLAYDEGDRFPDAADALIRDFYMDDFVGGASTIEHARKLREELSDLLAAGCLPLRKWSSSHPEALSDLPDSHKDTPLDFSDDDPMVKILGLCYLPGADAFSYRVLPFEGPATKRSVLSYISRCYDPLGLLCGVTCLAKQYIQKLWLLKNDWDDPLPEPLLSGWNEFIATMGELSKLRIPRCFQVENAVLRLVCYCDASTAAYAAAIYLQVQRGERAQVHLVKAKSRVAPLKVLSVPRLELLGALLVSRLLRSVLSATQEREYASIHMFTDSSIVLAWLRTPPHTLNTFVANRVVEITDLTVNCTWAHCRTELNPVDCGSRGLQPKDVVEHPLWWNGPPYLRFGPENWPCSLPEEPQEVPESKATALIVQSPTSELEVVERFSSLSRLQRVVAWMLRFANNARKSNLKRSGPLSAEEVETALLRCVRITQEATFDVEITAIKKIQSTGQDRYPSRLAKLSPFLDLDGLLRVGGRLRNSLLPHAAKHPLLLPKDSWLATLVCDYYHRLLLHAGPRQTLSFIRRKFWILSAHSLVRKRIHRCLPCFRLTATPQQPIMADLPACRVQPAPPFWATSSDFCGPFITKETTRRSSPRHKTYCCIFVDMVSKAVHLEAVSELSTPAFMAAFHRFCARRSCPAMMYTDCGRNYIGAARELKEVTAFLTSQRDELFTQLASLNVCWKFNPPNAPNFGGLHEAAVKQAKLLMYRQLGNSVYSFEMLSTYFHRIESVMNSRPLVGEMSSDVRDGTDLLTPGHLLVGRPLASPPEIPLEDRDCTTGALWKQIQARAQMFWRRFSREYLSTMTQRQKWTRGCENPSVGAVVYITGLATSPLSWPLGQIEALHPGPDNVVRVVTVRMANGTAYTRPTNRLVFLPTEA